MGDDDDGGDSDEGKTAQIFHYKTLTQNHLDTLKITFESYWEESSCYLMKNVADGENGLSWREKCCRGREEACRVLTAQWDRPSTTATMNWPELAVWLQEVTSIFSRDVT